MVCHGCRDEPYGGAIRFGEVRVDTEVNECNHIQSMYIHMSTQICSSSFAHAKTEPRCGLFPELSLEPISVRSASWQLFCPEPPSYLHLTHHVYGDSHQHLQ